VHPAAAELVERFAMERLPIEGTWFRQTWRGPPRPDGRPEGTAIVGLYCDDPPSRSLFHRLDVDEVWHFYAGDPIRLVLLHADGTTEDVILGGSRVQHVVPAGSWQAGELVPGGAWALFGCTMAPGFSEDGFEGGGVEALLTRYAEREEDIGRLGLPLGAPTRLPGRDDERAG
jgi:predicted cupin superfamily sugar epimerase